RNWGLSPKDWVRKGLGRDENHWQKFFSKSESVLILCAGRLRVAGLGKRVRMMALRRVSSHPAG
ncbi:hypothetical protein SB912_29165, partial [Pantoea sp. SIMBA_072]